MKSKLDKRVHGLKREEIIDIFTGKPIHESNFCARIHKTSKDSRYAEKRRKQKRSHGHGGNKKTGRR